MVICMQIVFPFSSCSPLFNWWNNSKCLKNTLKKWRNFNLFLNPSAGKDESTCGHAWQRNVFLCLFASKWTFLVENDVEICGWWSCWVTCSVLYLPGVEGVIALALAYAVGRQQMHLQVLLGLEPLAAHLTQLPADRGRVHVGDVLLQVAVVRVHLATLGADRLTAAAGWFLARRVVGGSLPQPAAHRCRRRPWNHPRHYPPPGHHPHTHTCTQHCTVHRHNRIRRRLDQLLIFPNNIIKFKYFIFLYKDL